MLIIDDNVDTDDPETIICVRLMDWCNRHKKKQDMLKRDTQRINSCSITSSKMVHVKR